MSSKSIFFENKSLIANMGSYMGSGERVASSSTTSGIQQGLCEANRVALVELRDQLSSDQYAGTTLAGRLVQERLLHRPTLSQPLYDTSPERNVQISAKHLEGRNQVAQQIAFERYLLTDTEWGALGIDPTQKNQWSPAQMAKMVSAIAEKRAERLCHFAEWVASEPEGQVPGGMRDFLASLPDILSIKERARRIKDWIQTEGVRFVIPVRMSIYTMQHGVPLEIVQMNSTYQQIRGRIVYDKALEMKDFAVLQQWVKKWAEQTGDPSTLLIIAQNLRNENQTLPAEMYNALWSEFLVGLRSRQKMDSFSSDQLCSFMQILVKNHCPKVLIQKVLETRIQGRLLPTTIPHQEWISLLRNLALMNVRPDALQPFWDAFHLTIASKPICDEDATRLYFLGVAVGDRYPNISSSILRLFQQPRFAHLAKTFTQTKKMVEVMQLEVERSQKNHPEVHPLNGRIVNGIIGASSISLGGWTVLLAYDYDYRFTNIDMMFTDLMAFSMISGYSAFLLKSGVEKLTPFIEKTIHFSKANIPGVARGVYAVASRWWRGTL